MPELELGPVWLSLQLAAVTVLVLLVIATPLAWWLAFTRSRLRTIIEAVVAMPLVLPPTVLGFYLLLLLGPAGLLGAPWLTHESAGPDRADTKRDRSRRGHVRACGRRRAVVLGGVEAVHGPSPRAGQPL